MNPLRQLQQMKLTNYQVDEAIEWIRDGDIPPQFRDQLQDFIVRDNKLVYEPQNLEYVRPRDRREVMESLYDQVESAGKGQNNWYRYITTKYLGITKRVAQSFLKTREDYQLTRVPTRGVTKPMIATHPFQIFAIDLVDCNQYVGVRENKRYRYIMSIMDLFSGYVWFKPLKKKEPEDVLMAFEAVIGESNDQIPTRVVSDNGTEFKGVFEEFLKNNRIKHVFTKSYTPEPHIEAVNARLRSIMRQMFVRTNSLAWLPHLAGIQSSKNTAWNENHGATPDQIMTKWEANNPEDRKYLRKLTKDQVSLYKSNLANYEENLLSIGDYVRIKLATRQTQIRQKIKAGNKKLVVVHWTPEVYRVLERKMPKQGRIGLPKYIVANEEGNFITKEGRNYPQLFSRYDLLKVSADQRAIISQKNANTLNRLNNPEDIMAQVQQPVAPVDAVAHAIPIARAEPIIKPVSSYKTADWNQELRGKEFTDEGVRYVILGVEYKRGDNVNNYLCDVVEKAKYVNGKPTVRKSDRPYYILYAVLKEAKSHKEQWFVPDYNEAIRNLEERDIKV